MSMNLDKHAIPLQPSFWIVVVAAGGTGLANIEFYQSCTVEYTKQDAVQSVLKQLAAEAPQLYARGSQLGGWRVTHVQGIAGTEMEKMFTECGDRARKRESEQQHLETNHLLQQIIRDKDINLLHRSIREGRITQYERLYLHEKLTEGQNINADQNAPTVSPVQL